MRQEPLLLLPAWGEAWPPLPTAGFLLKRPAAGKGQDAELVCMYV
jgi:hypothetical protein